MKRFFLISVIVLLVICTSLFIANYNPIKNFTRWNIVNDLQLKKEIKELNQYNNISYIGDDRYYILLKNGQSFIVQKEYTSIMNYTWRIFKEL